MYKQTHKEFKFWLFRFSFYKLNNKWTLRFELSSDNWS